MTEWGSRTIIGWEGLERGILRTAAFICFSLTLCLMGSAQEKNLVTGPPVLQGKSAQGQLTVTATVVSSVGIVTGPNGEKVLVVANAPAEKDNLPEMTAVQLRNSLREERSKEKNKRIKMQQGP